MVGDRDALTPAVLGRTRDGREQLVPLRRRREARHGHGARPDVLKGV